MEQLRAEDLVSSIVQLRRAIVKTRDRETRAALRDVEVRLRKALGPTVTKRNAARALGISVTALDRWVQKGVLAVVERPGLSRHELEAGPLLELSEQVASVRQERGESRMPVAAAIKRLGWAPRPGGRRVLRFDVASLPRPNISELELSTGFRSTTPEARVREVAELSRTVVASRSPGG